MGNWMIVPNNTDLLHHGVKEQRWGVRNGPPYPLNMSRKTYERIQKAAQGTGKVVKTVAKGTATAVKATAKGSIKAAKAIKKHNEETKAKKITKKNEKERAKTEKQKNKAVSRNSYQELYNMKDKLTYKELSDAMDRINLERKLYSLGNPPKKSFRDYVSKAMDTVRDLNNWYTTGRNAYNNIAELYNSTDEGSKNPMRRIGDKPKNENEGNKQKQNNQNQQNQGGGGKGGANYSETIHVHGNAAFVMNGKPQQNQGNKQKQNTQSNQNSSTNQQNGLPNKKKRKKSK